MQASARTWRGVRYVPREAAVEAARARFREELGADLEAWLGTWFHSKVPAFVWLKREMRPIGDLFPGLRRVMALDENTVSVWMDVDFSRRCSWSRPYPAYVREDDIAAFTKPRARAPMLIKADRLDPTLIGAPA
jgi:hypothetical protein